MDAAVSPLFTALLGPAFVGLPVPVRALHAAQGLRRYAGDVEVERGIGLLSRLVASATRLPPAGTGPLCVEIDASPDEERWTRFIGGRTMPSRLWRDGDVLCERLGLATFGFRLAVVDGVIEWRVVRVRVFGVSLPARWFTGVGARESAEDGRYRFDVWASLPIAGLLVHYRGALDVD
ncbi:DUF4166 domain-containing protein [Pseudoxanthomonas sp. Root630]|uniref:DUF4166 domain-containing protein n=1 Tax=Pseudoxanthomonas sp. Root630 TaxID=1736574 RepID=UPI000702B6FD|nr:DUF4166 domain-containing protein [Pseudoxanthomonas sp. Root630]KRA46755.1 hypothetical protein ASD72_06130 [Pseudoxanthomonas sp. Root630]